MAPRTPAFRTRMGGDSRRRFTALSRGFAPSGGYDGARGDLREFAEWTPSPGGPHSDAIGDLPTLRARARDLERNAPIATSAKQTTVLGVVGAGLHLQPRVDFAALGITEEQAQEFQAQAKRCFWTWAYGTPCDVERRNLFDVTTRKILSSAYTNGQAFVVRRGIERPRDLLSLKLQLLEADRCSTPDGVDPAAKIFDGIELDKLGAVSGFHFSTEHPGERYTLFRERRWDRVPAFDSLGERIVLHVRNPVTEERIGALHGVPALAPAIRLFKQIDRYTNAEIMAAVVSAMFTVFIKSAPGSPATPGLAAIDSESDELWGVPATQYKLDTGAIFELLEGQDISTANPGRPNANFAPFVTAMLEQVGTSIGIPYEVLVRRFNSSYSASKAAIEMAWAAFEMMRSWFVDDFAQPVYEWVLVESILRGHLNAPGFFDDPLMRMAYCSAEWVGPIAPQLDPVKAAAGSKALIDARLSTHQRETARLTGADWDETVGRLGKERKKLEALGLTSEDSSEPVQPEPANADDSEESGDVASAGALA